MLMSPNAINILFAVALVSNIHGSHVLQEHTGSSGSSDKTRDASTGHPVPCCLPYRFQAIIAPLPNFIDSRKAVTRMSRDWKNRLQIQESVMFISGGQEQVIRQTFLDFKHMIQYDYTPGGACQTSVLDYGMLEPCMPDNASYFGGSFMGAYNNKMPVNTWNFRRTTLNRNLEIAIVVTADRCVPVSEHISGKIGTNTADSLILFMNVTEQVDENVFQIPRICFGVQQM